jgi:predicted nucleotidyltransferase
LAQEEGYNRKLKSLEDQKKKLEERIRAEGDKSLNYEAMIRKINDER